MDRYQKKTLILRNKAILEEINSLDPLADHCRIVHLMTGYEFPWDMIRALEIALMRTFCSSSVSTLLHKTGEFRQYGQKRYDDTALLVAEFMQNGYDDDRGQRAIAQMNKIHSFYNIANSDYLFVLSTFVLMPIDWIDQFGWRKTSEVEKQALFYFFKEIGARMHLHDIPGSLAELKSFAGNYERENFSYRPSNHHVANATVNIVKGWMPFFSKPFVLPVMRCLLDNNMLQALGYKTPPAALKVSVRAAMKARSVMLRPLTFKKYPSFVTTERNRTYRHGYEIEKIGPEKILQKL